MNKQDLINLLEDETTYNEVLQIIDNHTKSFNKNIGDIPRQKFLCGGAVANTIIYLLNKDKFDKPIINDIDVFYFNHNQLGYNYLVNDNVDFFAQRNINNTIGLSGYEKMWYGSEGEEIIMVDTDRDGIINNVQIDVFLWTKAFNPTDYYQDLLKTFDLNCCSAGLDRVNNKILYTDDFVNFLLTNKIEVTNLRHPLQTSVRMKKKTEELKTDTSNFDIEMSLIQHSFLCSRSRYLGPEWVEKSKQYKDFLDKYFKKYEPPYPTQNELYEYTSTDFELAHNIRQILIDHYDSLILFWRLFVRNGITNNGALLLKYYKEKLGLVDDSAKFYWTDKHSYGNSSAVDFNQPSFFSLTPLTPNYFDCDFTYDELVRVSNFFNYLNKNHVSVTAFLVQNVKEQQKFIDYFKKTFIDKYGFVKETLLNKIVDKSYPIKKLRMGMSSLNVKDKINGFNKMIKTMFVKTYITKPFRFHVNNYPLRTDGLIDDDLFEF